MRRRGKRLMKWTSLISIIIINSFLKVSADHFVPVWEGENGFAHMNIIVVNALIDDVPMQAGDEIGIFDGDLCVGAGKLIGPIQENNFNSFLHLVVSMDDGSGNGYTSGDPILFRLWDQSEAEEVKLSSVVYMNNMSAWATDGMFEAGATSFVYLKGETDIEQTLILNSGWNLISLYVNPEDPKLENIFKGIISNGTRLKVMDEQGNIFEDWGAFGGWMNQIGDLQISEGYKVCVNRSSNITVIGKEIELPQTISLQKGWNIISYPLQQKINATDFFKQLENSGNLLKVQNQIGKSYEYWNSQYGWINNIGEMNPGEGYLVKVKNDVNLKVENLQTKSSAMNGTVQDVLPQYFNSKVIGNGVNHMNINLKLDDRFNEGDEIGIFDREICVGASVISQKDLLNGYIALVASGKSYSGNDGFIIGGEIQLKAWSAHKDEEIELIPEFIDDQNSFINNESTFAELLRINTRLNNQFLSDDCIAIFPNPASSFVNINLESKPGDDIEICIYDAKGISIQSLRSAQNFIDLENYKPGLYVVRLVLNKKTICKRFFVR